MWNTKPKLMKLLTFFLLFLTQLVIANDKIVDAQTTEIRNDLIATLVNETLAKSKLPGLALTVSKEGEIIYSQGFGYADLENKVNMLPTTQIRTASVAKVITATALGKLASEGKIDFDTPIGEYVTYLKEPFASLTIRQISGHITGIQHQPSSNRAKKKTYTSSKEMVQLVEETSLLFEPATKYQYSTLGYNLLAGVIESITGKSYADYMQEEIFTPLKMTQTFPDDKSKLTEKDAKMYYFKKEKLTLDKKYFNGSYKLAGAGFRSTSEDLVKMMNAYSNGFLKDEVVEEMFTSSTLKNGNKTNVGIGWRLNIDMHWRETIEHAGSWQGARTVVAYYPKEKLSISIMINAQCTFFIEETAHLIAQLFLNDIDLNQNLEPVSNQLSIQYNANDGTKKKLTGIVNMTSSKMGFLEVKTEIKFLQKGKLFYLRNESDYALITDFGMLYLKLKTSPKLEGELFVYQLQNDLYHMKNKPIFTITSKE